MPTDSSTKTVKLEKDATPQVVKGKSTDSQRQRLYRAEQITRMSYNISIGDGKSPQERADACQQFVNDVLARKYIQRKYPASPIYIDLQKGAHRWAHAWTNRIELPSGGSWAFTQLVVLHEMAHCFERRLNGHQFAGHDWPFAAIFLDIVRNVMGQEVHDDLKKQFKLRKVKFTAPRKRTMTVAQKDAAAARLEKAREAREKKLAPQRELRDKMMALYKKKSTGRCYYNGRWKGRMIYDHYLGEMRIDKSPMNMNHQDRKTLWDRYLRYEQERHGPISWTDPVRPPEGEALREEMMRYAMRFRPNVPTTTITGLTS